MEEKYKICCIHTIQLNSTPPHLLTFYPHKQTDTRTAEMAFASDSRIIKLLHTHRQTHTRPSWHSFHSRMILLLYIHTAEMSFVSFQNSARNCLGVKKVIKLATIFQSTHSIDLETESVGVVDREGDADEVTVQYHDKISDSYDSD